MAPTRRDIPATSNRTAGEIEKLRARRGPREPAYALSSLLAPIEANSRRTSKRLGNIIDLWLAHVPAGLTAHTSITAFRGGTLHVTASSAAVRFELERLLREGLLGTLRRAYRGTLSQVRVVTGRLPDAGA